MTPAPRGPGSRTRQRNRRDVPTASSATHALPRLLAALACAVAALLLAVTAGAAAIPIDDVIRALLGGGDATTRSIVLDLRLPRAALALVAGGALATSGAVFQALLRNPLAEPYILGVSGGAAVGAIGAIVLGATTLAAAVPIAALAGALAAVLLVYRIAAGVGGALDTRVLLLAGVVIGAFCNALILLLLTLADVESFRSAVFWMMGSLAAARWHEVGLLTLYTLPGVALLIGLARPLNLLTLGEETATYLGTRTERVKLLAYGVSSLLVAASVALCGVIGFIGLIVPHALRMLWGSDHRLLLPAAFLGGGAFLLLADTAARVIAAPAELPVGVVTALIGVPLFILLLARSRA